MRDPAVYSFKSELTLELGLKRCVRGYLITAILLTNLLCLHSIATNCLEHNGRYAQSKNNGTNVANFNKKLEYNL